MNKLSCPRCGKPLIKDNNSYKCDEGHCYDISKRGYINLLLNPDKAHNNPGDSKESLVARKEFLNKGYYDPILNEVVKCIDKYKTSDELEILDLGCGEGYYTSKIKNHFNSSNIYGLDISKIGIDKATRYSKDIYWIVGNSKNIPIMSHSLDFVCALFTVVNEEELQRVLKEGGYIIHVTANPYHLVEIKELIYDEIKIKSDKYIRLGFENVESYDLKKKVHISSKEDALNLLMMTPHYYHIKKEKRGAIDTLTSLDITIDIKVTVYKV
ncbi:MAG: methyltransferase domain-containing protein [Thomasclavelia sp.]|nr:methyltransferase domain-containing protein [Thomasclavelia sp.]